MTPADPDVVARAILAPVVDAALRGVALAGVIGVFILMLRRTRAAIRLSAWTLVLYGALAIPAVSLVLPAWQWPVPTIDAWQGWWHAPAAPASTAAARSSVTSGHAVVGSALAPAESPWSVARLAAAIYLMGIVCWAFLDPVTPIARESS